MTTTSIIIPTYNNSDTIERAIKSALKQSLQDIEVIVVDNGSTDSTKKIVSSIKDIRIKYLYTSIPNRSNARNIGISHAMGQYIQFLDSDDYLMPDKLRHDTEFLQENQSYYAIADAYEFIYKENKEVRLVTENVKKLYGHNIFPISTIMIKNENLCHFDTDLDYCEDWLFWAENLSNKRVKVDNDFVGFRQNVTGKNTMSNQVKMLEYQMLVRTRIKLSNFTPKIWLFKNDILLMLTFIIYCRNSKFYDYINKNNKIVTLICNLLLKTPLVSSLVSIKVKKIVNNNEFVVASRILCESIK